LITMTKKDLSIYIHIPFCVKKCLYCDFLSAAPRENELKQYKEALINEIRRAAVYAHDYTVKTVFIGGGTPSIYEGQDMCDIVNELKSSFENIRGGSYAPFEVTIECNPGTVDYEKLVKFRECGINRISFGLQSADNDELKKLGRIHCYEDCVESVNAAKKAGFDNINIDLISGLVGQSVASFEKTLRKVMEQDVKHISVYSLIVEEGTPFYEMYNPDNMSDDEYEAWEETDRQIYDMTYELFLKNGYERYEISNYARPGYECKHNIVYWERGDYLGLGIGAASLMNEERFKNSSDITTYIKHFERDNGQSFLHEEHEKLSKEDRLAEHIMLGLRKCNGISVKEVSDLYEIDFLTTYKDVIDKWVEAGCLEMKSGRLYCTEKGMSVNNSVIVDFVSIE